MAAVRSSAMRKRHGSRLERHAFDFIYRVDKWGRMGVFTEKQVRKWKAAAIGAIERARSRDKPSQNSFKEQLNET